MGNLQFHSESSARLFGGDPADYVPIHKFLDQSKLYLADWRHRALLHNTLGIALCEQLFGDLYTLPSNGKQVCTRTVAEQHIIEDLRWVPTPADFLRNMPIQAWMNGITPAQRNRLQNLSIQDEEQRCLKCETVTPPDARFCHHCGTVKK